MASRGAAVSEFLELPPAFPSPVSVSVLKVEPGDVLVLKYDGHISLEAAERVRQMATSLFEPKDVKAMILSSGLTLEGVLRGSDVATGPEQPVAVEPSKP